MRISDWSSDVCSSDLQEVVLAEARGDAVVEHHAVFAEHQAVTPVADGELVPGVGVDPVQQLDSGGALDVDLAQGGGVDDADAGAHRLDLAVHRVAPAPARLRAVPGAATLGDGLDPRAETGKASGRERRGETVK